MTFTCARSQLHCTYLLSFMLQALIQPVNLNYLFCFRYHLQALRHLYVQAVEPRLLFPVDIDTGEACYAPLKVTLKSTPYYDRYTYLTCAPNILPDLDSIEEVTTPFIS